MKAWHYGTVLLLLGFSSPLPAQLAERFEVVSARTSLPPQIKNDANDRALASEPEILISQRRFKEAATIYAKRVVAGKSSGDSVLLDRSCVGLFRTVALMKAFDRYGDSFRDCRPQIIDSLSGKVDRPAMLLTNPVFLPSSGWINTADPGVNYRLQVTFDIDENGKAGNFDFPVSEGYYLRYSVISALKETRFLPAMKNREQTASADNVVDVVFCLERGSVCSTGD
jgi:hypothetical protein